MKHIVRAVLLGFGTLVSFSQSHSSAAETKSPDLNLIVQSLERADQQNRARSRPYQVTRRYKVFRGDDKEPAAEVTARISFTPPGRKTFEIIQASGNPWAEKIVRSILEQETGPVREGHNRNISRGNYDFVFIRQENFGLLHEFVLRIIPKRKEKGLLLGQIWIDAKTFRVRRIEGVPAKSPSLWIKDIYVTLQFAEIDDMWIAVSLDSIATVRLLGRYTLTSLYVAVPDPASVPSKR